MNAPVESQGTDKSKLLECTGAIVGAYVRGNSLPTNDIPAFIRSVYGVLSELSSPNVMQKPVASKPAVPVSKSVRPGYIVCLEDGKRLKMLKRYLRTRYDMSPNQYRAKWGLPPDYPMVAPNYSSVRSELAKKAGLGRSGTRRRRNRG